MAQTLILGGSGFLGSNLARTLVARGERPRIFTRPSSSISKLADILDHIEVVYGDFMDDAAIRNATRGVDTVFHLISTTAPGMTIHSSVYDVFSNLVPTIRLAECCLENGVKEIIYASSGGTVYGEPQVIPIPEDHPLMPKSIYGQSKLSIENYLNFYARSTSLDVKLLRISNPYGVGQNPWGVQGIVAVAIGCLQNNRILKIYGEGEAIRDYIYIDDVVDAMLLAMERPGSTIVNVSSGIGYSVMDIVQMIEEISGCTIQKEFVPSRPGDVAVNILDNRWAKEIYGWKPKVHLREGLKKQLTSMSLVATGQYQN
jgi:UDP-glucose 4-epimerase